MAVVKGVKEKVHLPLYDSITVRPAEQLGKTQNLNILRFFQDITSKNKLQTNMQASSLLPHWNTFEARAMRVVISDLPAKFPAEPVVTLADLQVFDGISGVPTPITGRTGSFEELPLEAYVELKRDVETSPDKKVKVFAGEYGCPAFKNGTATAYEFLLIGRDQISALADRFVEQKRDILPPDEQVFAHNGFGTAIGKLIYNSVTTFYVGEKIMIQVPTWFFPSGAGPCANGNATTHGEASPEATFRFAEPIHIDAQQNFRVEIEFPDNEVMSSLQKLYGPFFVWVLIDGFMTRDVQ